MKNRIRALLLAGLLCIAMAGCGVKEANEPPKESETEEITAEPEIEVAPYEKGVVENNLYTNESIGLSLRIPTGWSAKSDYDLASEMGITYDFENTDKFLEEVSGLADIYDFKASNADENSHIIVLLQDLAVYDMDKMTAAEYLVLMKANLVTESATYETSEVTDVSYSGNTYAMMKSNVIPTEGENVTQYYFVRKANGRMVTVMLSFPASDPVSPDTIFA